MCVTAGDVDELDSVLFDTELKWEVCEFDPSWNWADFFGGNHSRRVFEMRFEIWLDWFQCKMKRNCGRNWTELANRVAVSNTGIGWTWLKSVWAIRVDKTRDDRNEHHKRNRKSDESFIWSIEKYSTQTHTQSDSRIQCNESLGWVWMKLNHQFDSIGIRLVYPFSFSLSLFKLIVFGLTLINFISLSLSFSLSLSLPLKWFDIFPNSSERES